MSDLYVKPSAQFETSLVGAPTGGVGTVGVQILDGDTDTVITARTTAGIVESPAGSGVYVKALTAPATHGVYRVLWDSGSISPSTIAVDRLEVTSDGLAPAGPGGPYILTLEEYKERAGLAPAQIEDDDQITALLPAVTLAITNFCERDFGAVVVTETREFEYDASGYLDIDDADSVTAVAVTVPNSTDIALDGNQWAAQPFRTARTPVYTYLMLPCFNYGFSPEMGFTRNLDVAAREGRLLNGLPTIVKVTGTFGWDVIPEDVKMAAAWTLQEWISRDEGEGLQSEAIESYSRSWGRGGSVSEALAIPNRARDLLTQYARILV